MVVSNNHKDENERKKKKKHKKHKNQQPKTNEDTEMQGSTCESEVLENKIDSKRNQVEVDSCSQDVLSLKESFVSMNGDEIHSQTEKKSKKTKKRKKEEPEVTTEETGCAQENDCVKRKKRKNDVLQSMDDSDIQNENSFQAVPKKKRKKEKSERQNEVEDNQESSLNLDMEKSKKKKKLKEKDSGEVSCLDNEKKISKKNKKKLKERDESQKTEKSKNLLVNSDSSIVVSNDASIVVKHKKRKKVKHSHEELTGSDFENTSVTKKVHEKGKKKRKQNLKDTVENSVGVDAISYPDNKNEKKMIDVKEASESNICNSVSNLETKIDEDLDEKPCPKKKAKKKKDKTKKEGDSPSKEKEVLENGNVGALDSSEKSQPCLSQGQWQGNLFENTERQNKFLRLLGGKKASQTSAANKTKGLFASSGSEKKKGLFGSLMTLSSGGGKAMSANSAASLNQSLEEDYNRALNLKLGKGKGCGFGFKPDPAEGKKFHIDTVKVKSVRFDDD